MFLRSWTLVTDLQQGFLAVFIGKKASKINIAVTIVELTVKEGICRN